MRGVKPWQIAIIGLGLLAACGSVFYACSSMGDSVKQASDAQLVDIRTGELFVAAYPDKRPVSFPAKNPTTGEATLYPVFLKDGKWSVTSLYLGDVRKDKSLKPGLLAEGRSGELAISTGSPKRADIFGK